MNFPDNLTRILRGSPMTRTRMLLALAVAVTADGLQLLLLPLAWTFAVSFVDVVAMVLTILILGFHPLLLPTFIIEFIPLLDELPTWTACVAAVIALRQRDKTP